MSYTILTHNVIHTILSKKATLTAPAALAPAVSETVKLVLYYTILECTILYYTILYCAILYYTILYYTILFYTILYYYYTMLYYAIL